MMKKKVMMIVVAPTSYTQKKRGKSKTARGNTKKQMQPKPREKSHETVQ
jgi:hypothetical protein